MAMTLAISQFSATHDGTCQQMSVYDRPGAIEPGRNFFVDVTLQDTATYRQYRLG